MRWLDQHQYLALWRCSGQPNQMTSSPTAFRATGETWTLADHPTANDIKLAYIHNILSLAGDVNAGRLTVLLISYLLSVAVAEVARVGQHEEDIFWMGTRSMSTCWSADASNRSPVPPRHLNNQEKWSWCRPQQQPGGAGKVWGQHSSLARLGPGVPGVYLLQCAVWPHY